MKGTLTLLLIAATTPWACGQTPLVESPAPQAANDVGVASAAALDELLASYETIRLALLADTLEGVAEAGGALGDGVRELEASFSPQQAGVPEDGAETVETLLPEIAASSEALTQAADLEAARDAFSSLSEALIVYFETAGRPAPTVIAHCPMAHRSWLQPEGEIGNPYYGQSMPRCGEVTAG
jgi:Cu(I)/Ag(I) efflux system membrane fusion protein